MSFTYNNDESLNLTNCLTLLPCKPFHTQVPQITSFETNHVTIIVKIDTFFKMKRGFTAFISTPSSFVKKGKLFVKHVSIFKSNYRPLYPLEYDTGHSVQANPYQTATQKSKVNSNFFPMLNIYWKRACELWDLQLHMINQHNVLCTHPIDCGLHWSQRWNELLII